MHRGLGLLVVSFIMVPTIGVGQGTPRKSIHPGTIVDAYSRKGIMADAYAYSSQSPGPDSGCPTYPSSLDNQKSSSGNGSFSFHIDSQISGYLAVYCQQGYAPRTETANDNSTDRTRVQPDPITLFPKSVASAGQPTTTTELAGTAIGYDLEGLSSNLQYYRKSSPEAFIGALQLPGLSDKDRNIISSVEQMHVLPRSSQQLPREKTLDSPRIAFVAIVAELNHARSDLIYYERADREGYVGALGSIFPKERTVIESIRTRTVPFGQPEAEAGQRTLARAGGVTSRSFRSFGEFQDEAITKR